MGNVNFDLMGRERAQVSEDSALFVSNWSLDHSERYRELRRKIRAAIAAVAVLDGPLTEELLEILNEMEQQEPPLPDDLCDLQRAARVALT